MKYIADIIPSNAKVLPDYFKAGTSNRSNVSVVTKITGNLLAGIFFLFALGSIPHPLLALLSGLMGIGLLPAAYPWISRKLQFDYTPAVRRITYAILLVPFLGLVTYYSKVDAKVAGERQVVAQRQQQEQAVIHAKDSIRRDSLRNYLALLKEKQTTGKLAATEAGDMLAKSFSMAESPEEKQQVQVIKFDIDKDITLKLVKAGQYKPAITALTDLLAQAPEDVSLLYNRALCYDKTGAPEEAVRDLRQAMKTGSQDAEKYHDKINPERKRVIGYVTRCCDGSTSNAKGRGACSSHGGVCNWNDPVYETYRKYE
ncbi:tetratricopeptide repeat protein [Chitinophaga nivalis]|uniref:Tetratricopeptide repeat protein n=1 Tax=Chitinophaga nivalis TaxID=2991709 RepID=A0ABT3IIS9_9BACT|nr:tetratricopeptide repeat protein [Chitinophaga nivalis]MCW3466443.1 tetratricopeptide repeat protein [Chitinophaga nivalis]MCW3483866.1 tetratricopeptide repeat protein [Chitinophaga nivalis]